MRNRADLAVHDKSGGVAAVIEVKNRENLSPELAAYFRRNMLVHGALPAASYFALLSQDTGFLWTQNSTANPDALPDVQFSMREVLDHYTSATGANDRLPEAALELLVAHWLEDLTQRKEHEGMEPERLLASVGFVDALQGGIVTSETVA